MSTDDARRAYEAHLERLKQAAAAFAEHGPPSAWANRDDCTPDEQAAHDKLYAAWLADPIGFLTPPPPDAPQTFQEQMDGRRELAAYFATRGEPRAWAPLLGITGDTLEAMCAEYAAWKRDPVGWMTPPVFVAPTGGMVH